MLALSSSLVVLASLATLVSAQTFRLATYNLRFDSRPDSITVNQSIASIPDPLTQPGFLSKSGEQPWSQRRLYIAERIINEGTAIFSIQEGLVRQVNDLQELLGSGWSFVLGRDDGKTAGEFSAIFFRLDTVTLRTVDFFWLSNTPDVPSKFPSAGSIRICTAGKFTTSSGTNFTLLNTHLDDQSDDQRKLGGSMILTRARFEAVVNKEPVLVTGDFNSQATGSDSGAYQIVTGALAPVAVNATFAAKFAVPDDSPPFTLLDLREQAPPLLVGRNFATFTGFTAPTDTSQWKRIDFAFGGSNGGWTAGGYKVETSLTDDGVLASDHRPVFADVTL
ncbi:mannose-6-phosphatase [Exidia glandulosa HHB12029]|uniref:Mannose-6-phosphatase n=1 Tax=Exidia glandulosa HHB12029 TaxID=1314781 RepID=A0A165EYA9_EXIGL|nr:mannose-6-phosphatase [Exidia glandulosa HHB12029]